ncbi:MAG: hypothetical protein KJ902_02125 [Candidatus Omnitrophica bacterium]|nr:hypothetical protein [Candidatus Omnitrophota bacterium]MBU4457519.1 hypothetical protein [Candidatus Omnitrophota bacterium]
MRRYAAFVMILILLVSVAGCKTTRTERGAGGGALLGAGLGAIIGHQSGRAKEGALIGAGVGAAGGALAADATAIKFCPECGEDFGSDVQYCPGCGTELKIKK